LNCARLYVITCYATYLLYLSYMFTNLPYPTLLTYVPNLHVPILTTYLLTNPIWYILTSLDNYLLTYLTLLTYILYIKSQGPTTLKLSKKRLLSKNDKIKIKTHECKACFMFAYRLAMPTILQQLPSCYSCCLL
jgi:hypothetical protein